MNEKDIEDEVVTPEWGNFRPGFHNTVQTSMLKHNLPDKGRNYVLRTLAGPSRRPKSGVANCSGSFPSQKMGMTIGFESRTLEYARAIRNEADTSVLGYVSQLPALKISYKCQRTGRTISYLQRPDFLEIYDRGMDVVECKPLSILHKWVAERPGFVYQAQNGDWRCPSAEAACGELGLNYRLVSEQDHSPTELKNLRLLIDFIQTGNKHGRDEAVGRIVKLLEGERRLSIEQVLYELADQVTPDDVYRAIATSVVAVDMEESSLVDHERTFLYASDAAMQAYKISAGAISRAAIWMRGPIVNLEPKTRLNWNGRVWHLINLGLTKVSLHNGLTLEELDRPIFDDLIRNCSIVEADGGTADQEHKTDASHRMLQEASPGDLVRALKAYHQILPYRHGTAKMPPSRTVRRNLCKWKKAEAALGNGFVGLFPHYSLSGNRAARIDPAVMRIVKKETHDHYATTKKSRRNHVHERIVAECERASLPPPSYAWYCRFLKRLPAYELKLAREGRKAAYNLEPRHANDGAVLDARADASFQKGHLDHTEIELATRCSRTSVLLGRPWLTTLVDDYSGDVLAWYLTWDPPSYRSVMMVLRDCVRRHGRLPDEIVVDGGKDMASTWFEVTCAFYCVTITRRPAGKARFGSRGERLFGTIDTSFLHNCLGNTQLRKNVRQMTPEVDPDHKAVWTMGSLIEAFERYFDHYRNLVHRELLVSPRVAMERGLLAGSGRVERRIAYNRDFLISTCPTTKAGQAKVQADGVKINYLYYSCPTLRLAYGKKVPVRFDPGDMSIAYALVEGQWLALTSRYANTLKGRTERELHLAREEYFRHRRMVEKTRLTEKTFINFLEYLDRTEAMLIDHHRAIEMRRAAASVDDALPDKSNDDTDEEVLSGIAISKPVPASPFALAAVDIVAMEVE
ncbi:MAG: transposase family protein [Polaromonas sp.]|nr:transposase family protein [Polaromonas sp.]MDP3752147.1 transposase family protein [Polaromonas sp.]